MKRSGRSLHPEATERDLVAELCHGRQLFGDRARRLVPEKKDRPRIAKLGENLVFRVVDQDVPIGEVKNLRTTMLPGSIPTRVP